MRGEKRRERLARAGRRRDQRVAAVANGRPSRALRRRRLAERLLRTTAGRRDESEEATMTMTDGSETTILLHTKPARRGCSFF